MISNTITKNIEEIKNKQTEMNNTITEIKNTLKRTNSRITEAEKWISELEPFSSGPRFIRAFHHDPFTLGGPAWHGS